nr:MAG TPA: hypothetical protein [Caudoviricetes sp.]
MTHAPPYAIIRVRMAKAQIWVLFIPKSKTSNHVS